MPQLIDNKKITVQNKIIVSRKIIVSNCGTHHIQTVASKPRKNQHNEQKL
jgi:hypothetical protein